ncbi:hypothetical protein CJ030_MR2G024671 [Morella rubra]|uniref:Uncharacterized protein n=1 Tax=Morella rubra TaxID=262757 RepID=A0A6A1WEN5_9ROSI|nr:hypothetical protein CJ030_MR2G024671 [Morella rubra]
MAEAEPSPRPTPTFLEVMCQRSGKTRRFAVGTDSGFALSLINGGLDRSKPLASHIEAFKEGEEPIAFGPKSDLVDYGHGWKLRTVLEPDFDCGGIPKGEGTPQVTARIRQVTSPDSSHLGEKVLLPVISFLYIGKIIVVFVLMLVLGAIFTLALENLPQLILFFKSSV